MLLAHLRKNKSINMLRQGVHFESGFQTGHQAWARTARHAVIPKTERRLYASNSTAALLPSGHICITRLHDAFGLKLDVERAAGRAHDSLCSRPRQGMMQCWMH